MNRCSWCGDDPLYVNYHDKEWGVPVHDETKHFEFLVLESAQAGLSWITILRKRENYSKAFDKFNPLKVSKYNDSKVKELLNNAGIVRNIKKIEAAINNANRFLEIQKEFKSFDNYIWKFTDYKPVINKWKTLKDIPAKTKLSDEIAKDMKKRGFKFLGSITLYAHIQATGIVNDHIIDCFRYKELISK